MALATGDEFAGFVIEETLGAGGMGVVYAARHPRLDRIVALKVLHDNLSADRHAHVAFDREAALCARLDHPNIVAVHDRSASGDPALWLAMRYIRGGDAAALITEHPRGLEADLATGLIADAAAALDYAHAHGVLHRDVKPANLLIEADARHGRRALLTDFGIARTLDSTVTLSAISASVAYAAPERFAQAPADPRADIYSLGATLFHLLTGQQPFPRSDQAAVIGAHLSAPPPAPSRLRPDLPVELDTVIATAMAKEPAARYPTCTALADAARAAATAPATHAPAAPKSFAPPAQQQSADDIETVDSVPSATAPGRRINRRRLLTAAGIAVPITAATAVGITLGTRRSSEQTPGTKVVPTPVAEPRLQQPNLTGHTSAVYSVDFSPDGSRLVTASYDTSARLWNTRTHQQIGRPLVGEDRIMFTAAFNHSGTLVATGSADRTLRLWDARSHDQVAALDHPDSVYWVAFSPDDSLLATVCRDEKVRVWNARTHQQVGAALNHPGPGNAVAFDHAGSLLATGTGNAAVRLWDPQTHRQVGDGLNGHADGVSSLAFAPDDSVLAVASGKTVRLWDLRTRTQIGQPLTGHAGQVHAVSFFPDGARLASASADGTVRFWKTRTGEPTGPPLRAGDDPLYAMSVSPDGTLLAAAGEQDVVQIWSVAETA